MGFWQPWLKPHQTYLIWLLLEGREVPERYEKTREELREWFEAEVKANADKKESLWKYSRA